MILRGWLVAALIGAAQIAPAAEAASLRMFHPGEPNTYSKHCVVDGDTLWLHGRSIRLQGFDTPEPTSQICGGEQEVALAHRASNRLQQLLNTEQWTIELGGIEATGKRTLGSIWIVGRGVGDILIDEGLARRWPDGDEFWCRR